MKRTKIILASASPRRRELLEKAGYEPKILLCGADESTVKYDGDPYSYVMALARLKNDAAYESCGENDGILLSADTIVVLPDESINTRSIYARCITRPLGKPHSREEAIDMITRLSGRTHKVITGVMLRSLSSGKEVIFAETTDVTFRELSDCEIEEYCGTDEPYDKAGGYGIQGGACIFVKSIAGDYCNVVGLPICRVHEELLKLN